MVTRDGRNSLEEGGREGTVSDVCGKTDGKQRGATYFWMAGRSKATP
jgi:hypothetical protein